MYPKCDITIYIIYDVTMWYDDALFDSCFLIFQYMGNIADSTQNTVVFGAVKLKKTTFRKEYSGEGGTSPACEWQMKVHIDWDSHTQNGEPNFMTQFEYGLN